jgi:hypothetical protein
MYKMVGFIRFYMVLYGFIKGFIPPEIPSFDVLKSLSRRLLVGRRGEVVGPRPPPTRTVQLPIGFLAVEVGAHSWEFPE